MFRPYFLLRYLSPDGGLGGAVNDSYGDEDDTFSQVPAPTLANPPTPAAPALGTPGTETPAGLGVGPALGEAGLKTELTIEEITGKPAAGGAAPKAPGAAPATGGAVAPNFAGFSGGANEFAEKIMGQPGGLIQFAGEAAPVAFATLTPQEQQQVISDWTASQPKADELRLLHDVRSAGGVQGYLSRQLDRLSSTPAQLSDDDVTRAFIKRTDPELDEAGVQAALDYEKGNPRYAKVVADRRTTLDNEQKAYQNEMVQAEQRMYVEAARATNQFFGVAANDEHRQLLLNDVLEPDKDDPTQTKFVKLFEDPKEVLQMVWLKRFGAPLLQQAIANGFLRQPAPTPAAPVAPTPTGGAGGQGGNKTNDVFAE